MPATQLPDRILVEADLFISYLTADNLEKHFKVLVDNALTQNLELFCSSEVYDDITTSMLTEGINAAECSKFLSDTKLIPHKSLPVTTEISSNALKMYSEFGGRRRLHYFDAYHICTATANNLPLYTSDKYVINNSKRLGVSAVDVRTLES